MRSVILVGCLMVATPAVAGDCAMFFCDSRCNTGGAGYRFPDLVDQARTDLTVCVSTVNGRNTVEGLADVDAAITACKATCTVESFVVLMGVADALEVYASVPEDTADRLREIHDRCVAAGIPNCYIGTEPPAPTCWTPYCIDANIYTRETAFWLRYQNEVGPVKQLLHLRDRLTWNRWAPNSTDDLHPTNSTSRQDLADEPITVIP